MDSSSLIQLVAFWSAVLKSSTPPNEMENVGDGQRQWRIIDAPLSCILAMEPFAALAFLLPATVPAALDFDLERAASLGGGVRRGKKRANRRLTHFLYALRNDVYFVPRCIQLRFHLNTLRVLESSSEDVRREAQIQ